MEGHQFIDEELLALDARVVRVEGLADKDHVQVQLVCKFRTSVLISTSLQLMCGLCTAGLKVFGHYSGSSSRKLPPLDSIR
jgi:hypothetical protein